MTLQSIESIDKDKKDVPLYYRNDYKAKGNFINTEGKAVVVDFLFSVERLPTGESHIKVNLIQDVDYPLLPIIRALKGEILQLEQKGLLH